MSGVWCAECAKELKASGHHKSIADAEFCLEGANLNEQRLKAEVEELKLQVKELEDELSTFKSDVEQRTLALREIRTRVAMALHLEDSQAVSEAIAAAAKG